MLLCDEWSDGQVKAFRLLEIEELKTLDFDLSLTGFEPFELDGFLFGEEKDDRQALDVPMLPEDAITQVGDLWMCGDHRVRCGDATSAEVVSILLGSTRPAVMVADPPYGVDYDPDWREQAGPWESSARPAPS